MHNLDLSEMSLDPSTLADLESSLGRVSLSLDESGMQRAEQSHFYSNDVTMQSLHSQPLPAKGARSFPQTVYTKPSREDNSPPPEAKRTQSITPQQVRHSIADLVFRPVAGGRSLRSKGPIADVPNI